MKYEEILAQTTTTSSDAWRDWDDHDHHHCPPVPEPSTYGLIFVSLILCFIIFYRWRKNKKAKSNAISVDRL